MKFDEYKFRVYGDVSFRGKCPVESIEQITFFNRLRSQYPKTLGVIGFHPRNEQLLIAGQHSKIIKQKAEGLTPGAADIIIPGSPTFVCELKRRDHTKSKWEPGQVEFLTAAYSTGSFVSIALGCDAAWQALNDWIKTSYLKRF